MKRAFLFFTAALLVTTFSLRAEENVSLKDLPPAAQKTVQDLIRGAEMKGLSKEKANGHIVYEVETIKNGKTRDALVAANGTILEIEEGTTLNEIPEPAKTAIEKAAANGKITKIEIITKGNSVSYEAVIRKTGKNSEIQVKADGSLIK